MYGQKWSDNYYNGYQSIPIYPNYFPGIRKQPYPVMQGPNDIQQLNMNPYMNTKHVQDYSPIQGMNPFPYPSLQYIQPQSYYQQQVNVPDAQSVFQNPLHPGDHSFPQQQHIPAMGQSYMNPYPKASFLAKQPSGMQSVLNSFKSQDGSLDINKMVDTAGQMINAVTQVSSIVKGFGGMFKA